jgi:uncharacterized membrane protein YfcA
VTWIVVWGLTAIAGSIAGALLAGIKNRDWSHWATACFLLPPLVLVLLMMPKRQGPRPRRPTLDEEDRHPW